MPDPRLGRRARFDPKSRDYGIKRLTDGLPPISKTWNCSKVLDQLNEGSCVGHGIAHELIADPIPCDCVDHDYAVHIYEEAKKLDDWPGENYQGTSVLAGLQAVKSFGWSDEYRWSFSHLDTQLGIGYEAPGIAGTNWYTGMGQPDSNGFIHTTGYIEGGHCYLYLGVNIEEAYFLILNSWGKWGIDGTGRAKLSFDDYEKLRKEGGEMAFLMGRHNMCGVPIPPNPEPPMPPEPNPCAMTRSFLFTTNKVAQLLRSKRRFYSKKEVL